MRRKSIITGAVLALLIVTCLVACKKADTNKTYSFGVIADCQYCDDPGTGVRKYSASKEKLARCIDHFNSMELEYVVHLGDFIDKNMESFRVVEPIFKNLSVPGYHVLGNHDFSVRDDEKEQIPQVLGMPSRYYDFEIYGWRFIVLDGNDISFHAYPAGSAQYREAAKYYEENGIQSPKWNGAVGDEQLEWLKNRLNSAAKDGEKVILYCHFPVYPDNPHNLWNAKEIMGILEDYSCVKAYVNGHNHEGNYGEHSGIHYITVKGMVDTYETSYAVFTVRSDSLEIRGYGREEHRVLSIKN
ncbi:MAG: metallophosphoesterase [Cytophagales bacterium]|nr:metallophosphoesterase [Cytophagales bacterium]